MFFKHLRYPVIAVGVSLQGLFPLYGQAAVHVPPGFEELAKGQIIWLETLLYGESLGLQQARVDLDTVTFLQPEELSATILKRYGHSAILQSMLQQALRSPLPRNGNLACSTNGMAAGCGYIDTETLAVIYDENHAQLNLFIGQSYSLKPLKKNLYHDATLESRSAFIHQQNINFVADRNSQSASLQGNGSLGITNSSYANVDWNWLGQRFHTDEMQSVDINNAYIRQDLWKRYYVQAGVMDSRDIFSDAGGAITLSQLPLKKIKGVRTGTTLAWLNKNKASHGTPVTVFLTQDSRVDVYREKQLLASFYLKAGMQELDTQTFPAGSYTVTLRVYQDNQLMRTETVPYTGSGNAPLGSFQWFMQLGKPDDATAQAHHAERSVFQGGARVPLTGALSVTTGSAILGSASYWEGAADWSHTFNSWPLDGLLTARTSLLSGNQGTRGNIQQISYNDGFSLSFYRSAMSAPNCDIPAERHSEFSGCYTNTNLMLSVPISQWYASLGYTSNTNEGRYVYRHDSARYSAGAPIETPWEQAYVTRSHSRTWQAGLTRTFSTGNLNLNTAINAFIRDDVGLSGKDRGFFASFSLSQSGGPNDARNTSTLSASWRTRQRNRDQLSYNAAYSRYMDAGGENEVGMSAYGLNSDTITTSAYGRAGGRYGNASLTLSESYDRVANNHTFGSSGNYSSSLIIDRSGLQLGRWGDGTPASAITVNVGAEEQTAGAVNVSLDTGGYADIRSNSRALFTVPGYRQSTVTITESLASPAGVSNEINFGAGSRSVFMAPGRVYDRNVTVKSLYTWLGRLQNSRGQPLQGGIPLNVMSWTPLQAGGFTLETTRLMNMLYVMREDEFWQCRLAVRSVRDIVHYVGNTTCHKIPMADLPAIEKKQAALMTVRPQRNNAVIASNNNNVAN